MIGPKTAFVLFALLIGFAVVKLHGTPLTIALVIVLGLAAKAGVEYYKRLRGL